MEHPHGYTPCLYCGGDPTEPGHWRRCDGRQGEVEADADELPLLISGLVPPTYDTSTAAAVSVITSKDTQRAEVKSVIRLAAQRGCTDDEIQIALGLDGSSERPRRWELWKLGEITIQRDDHGEPVRRLTRTNRRAVVWEIA